MPATVQLMDSGGWNLDLDPRTPRSVLDRIGIRSRLWATLVVTPDHWPLGELSATELLNQAVYTGVLLTQGRDRLSLNGEGMAWWLGGDGDGGNLYAGVDQKPIGSARDLEDWVTDIIATANGVTKGNVNSNSTTFNFNREGGDTPREMLDTLVRSSPGSPYMWRMRHMTLDVDTRANLWPSTTAPTVMLTDEGGPASRGVTGFYTELELDQIDGREVRTNVQVDWNDGTDNGTSSPTLPSTYRAPGGGAAVVRALIDWKPKRPRPPTERWRKVAIWGIASQTRANQLAAAEANERSAIREEITARLPDLINPWPYDLTPGNTVYLEDMDRGLVDTANQIHFRGETSYPTTGRVDEMTVPFHETFGKYLRYWDGSAFQWIDLTRYALGEEGGVQLALNQRSRFPVRARPRRLTRRDRQRWFRRSRQEWRNQQLEEFYESIS